MKNAYYVTLFIVVIIVAPTILRLIGIPSYDVFLSNIFGDNKVKLQSVGDEENPHRLLVEPIGLLRAVDLPPTLLGFLKP